ncbi:hypothetical protein BGX26_007059 [Mortierella sp. AD094]|nr:hypothetical protein BGX26_007059 [Mortierella sp. AD094]
MDANKTYISAPANAPQLEKYCRAVPVEEMTAISFYKFHDFKQSEQQKARHLYRNVLLEHAFKMCNSDITHATKFDWEQGKETRKDYWLELMYKEEQLKIEQEAGRSKEEVKIQAEITVNCTTSRVLRSAQKKALDHLNNIDESTSPAPPASPTKTAALKKRGRKPATDSNPVTPKPRIGEPWHSIVDLAILMYTDWDVTLPPLEESHSKDIGCVNKEILYRIALKNLHEVQPLHKTTSFDKAHCLNYKDAFVCLSGIWNLYSKDLNKEFGPIKLQEAEKLCWAPHLDMETPDAARITQPLLEMLLDGKDVKDLLEYTYNLQLEHPRMRTTISVLQHIGEQGCAATTLSKSMLAEVFETGNTTRKCDCLLTVDGLEVGNFEAKRESSSVLEAAVQLRKNAKINKSILLELEKYELECPPILNIQGLTATISKIVKYEDIWAVGPACSSIALPAKEEDVQFFLENGAQVLFNLLNDYHVYGQRALSAKRRYEYTNRVKAQDSAVSAEARSAMEVLEWEKVVLHSPTKPSKERRPSLLEAFAAARDD